MYNSVPNAQSADAGPLRRRDARVGDALMGESGEKRPPPRGIDAVAKAASIQSASPSAPAGPAAEKVRQAIAAILSDDLDAYVEGLADLSARGEPAAAALVERILDPRLEPGQRGRLAGAIEAIGRSAATVLEHVLQSHGRIHTPHDVYLLETLAESLARIADRRAIPVLRGQVQRLDSALATRPGEELKSIAEGARGRLLTLLADLGDASVAEPLQRLLGDGRSRVEESVLQGLARVGDSRALKPLLRLFSVEQNVSDYGSRLIRTVFREIARRTRTERDACCFEGLPADERVLLDRMFPARRSHHTSGRNGNGHHNGNGHSNGHHKA